jgi:ribonuclease P protein component
MLPQVNRLRKKKEIERVFKVGRNVFNPICGFKFQANGLSLSRFSIIIGLKVSKSAVKRNRLRRQVREVIRLNLSKIRSGFDFAFIISPKALGKDYQELEQIILSGLKRAGLFIA